MLRKVLLALLAVVLVVVAITTRGSIGSGVCIYCLIMMGASLLIKHFLINREDDSFESE